MIETGWREPELTTGTSSIVLFKEKLKKLKIAIKTWANSLREAKCKDKNALIYTIKEMEALLENCNGDFLISQQRSATLQQLRHLEHKDNMDMMQKEKIKCAVELMKIPNFYMVS